MLWIENMIKQLIKNFKSQSRAKIRQHQENSLMSFWQKKRLLLIVQRQRQNVYKTLVLKKVNLIKLKEIPFDEFLTELEIEKFCQQKLAEMKVISWQTNPNIPNILTFDVKQHVFSLFCFSFSRASGQANMFTSTLS